ncbi:MAG: hypothetical protein DRI94_06960 [Bacteroidetes bacterium]|nr:MAG: hypothetical protein DRI94_06960 [Bacteroidota bacterium]
MKNLLLIIFSLLIANISFSQTENLKELKSWQLKAYGKSAERYGDLNSVVKYYSEYYARNKKDEKTAFKLANSYFEIKNFEKAKPIFYELYLSNSKKYPKAVFRYGQILKKEEKFDSAAACFLIYRDNLIYYDVKSNKDANLLMVERELKSSENESFKKSDNSEKIQILKLNSSINKNYKESSPVIWNDTTLIYTSLMIDSFPVINVNTSINVPTGKYYSAGLINNDWQGGNLPPEPFVNFENKSVSSGVLSDDGKRFYFAAGSEDIHGNIFSSIYVRKLKNGIWSQPEKLDEEINPKKFMTTQPALGKCYNPNFDVLYFVSDRPGGIGGTDIWYSVYDKVSDMYNKPINAGTYINSPENEISPMVDNETKALYFSSDGHSGYGGYDVYKSYGELVNWIPPKNIGKPINSVYDDFYYTKLKNDSMGFIVSNRKGNPEQENPHCCYDIFEFYIQNKKVIEITDTIFEADEDFYDKLITQKDSVKNVNKNSSKTVVKLHIKNNKSGEYICLATDTTDNSGKFHFKVDENQDYKLTVEKKAFAPTSVIFNTNKLVKNKLNVKPLTIIPDNLKPISLKNIYFEFNQWNLNESSKQYLDTFLYQIMLKNKDIVTEISAYTDGLGDSDYNLVLSKKRAESVVNYLTQKGINKARLIAKGYGEEKPIASEKDENGNDIPEGRAKNRRIELRVVGVIIQ